MNVWHNKKGFKLSTIILSVIIFSVMVFGLSTFYADTVSTYGLEDNLNISSQYNKLSQVNETSQAVFSNIENINDTGVGSTIDLMVKGTYASVRTLFGSFVFVNAIIQQAAMDLHIPTPFLVAIISILLIGMAVAVISALFKVNF